MSQEMTRFRRFTPLPFNFTYFQLKEFVSVEQINESKFGKAERILGDDKGFLRISYTLSEGSKHCEELVQLATKAINLAENVAEGDVICNHENIEIKKID